MDEQYVQGLLQDQPEAAVEAESQAVVEEQPAVAAATEPDLDAAAEAFVETSVLDDYDLDSAFDLGLGDELGQSDPLEPPMLDETAVAQPQVEAVAEPQTDADEDFEALLAQAQVQAEPEQEPQSIDDLADFDLDIGEPVTDVAEPEEPVDVAAELAAFDAIGEFDPISELELPEDFDLSLSLDDESPAAKSFASELDDVNAELDRLSQSLESPSLEQHFTAADAAQEPDPLDDLDFDFFSGSDEVATKLDLARAYIDMGDHQGARDILDEVVKDGDDSQRLEAEEMLSRLV